MVSRQELWNHLGRRPFRPFRVVLNDGRAIDIVRFAQAASNDRWFLGGLPPNFDRSFRVRLDEINRIETEESKQTGS
jgi:hypothetical protein